MIIDCDTHFLPRDAYDYCGSEWDALRPHFAFDEKGQLTTVDFPGLRFVFTEAGVSFVKPLVAHLDAVFHDEVVDYESEYAAPRFNYRKLTGGKRIVSEADYKPKNKSAPSHYFKTNLFFTIETEESELAEAVQLFGPTQFLFATDYPHDDPGGRMKYRDVDLFRANAAITDADKELIWHRNAERLLGIVAG